MSMPALPAFYSREMVLALPDDGQRYETVHGELLVTPSPRLRHQDVLARLHRTLAEYVERHGLGKVLFSPADISWGPDILVQPDLFVIAPEQANAEDWEDITRLLLVVEILSPSSARADRFTKRRLYQEQAIPTYWVVDIDAAAVETWTPEATFPEVARDVLRRQPVPGVPALEVPLGALLIRE